MIYPNPCVQRGTSQLRNLWHRLVISWFSLRRLGPWMNHLPRAWLSIFRLTFQNESWYVSLEWYFICLLFLASVHGFMHDTSDFFYSIITFSYIKYFVHSYTVDVVFARSYWTYSFIHCAVMLANLYYIYIFQICFINPIMITTTPF